MFCNLVLFPFSVSLMLCGQMDILFCSIKNLEFSRIIDKGGTAHDGLREKYLEIQLSSAKFIEKFKYCNEKLDDPFSADYHST